MSRPVRLLLLLLLLLPLAGWGQTTIFNVTGGGTLPAGWVGTNNVTTNAIDRTSYYLVDAGAPSDLITTSSYDLSPYTTATFSIDVATFGSGGNNPAKIEVSLNGGTSYTQTVASTTPTTTSYVTYSFNLSSVSNQVVLRISNNGTTGQGVRLRNLVLTASGTGSPTITATPNSLALGSTATGTASVPVQSYDVSGSGLTAPITITAPAKTEVSLSSGGGYAASLSLPAPGGTVATTTIYVRIAASAAAGPVSGNVTNASTGATTQNVTVTGAVTGAPTVAVLTTTAATAVTTTTASTGGNITSNGGSAVTTRGVVYGTAPNPRLNGPGVTNVADATGGSGSFTSSLTGLTASTTYYVAAYATNGAGTGYGPDVTFMTPAPAPAFFEDFEMGTKSTSGYALGTVPHSTGTYTYDDALIGTGTTDPKNGSRSARLRNGSVSMNFDKTGGAGIVTVSAAHFSNDTNGSLQVEYSTDGGMSYTVATGSPQVLTSTLTQYSFTLNVPGAVRLRLVNITSGSERINVDDLSITDFAASPLTTGTIAGAPFCVGATNSLNTVAVPFTSAAGFMPAAGNVYTAQLSDASGSFASPVSIGTLSSTANSGTIAATLPSTTASGTGYRIRVEASSPATTGTANGTNLTAVNYLTNRATALTVLPGNGQATLSWTNPTTCFARAVVIARAGGAVTVKPAGTFAANAQFGSGTDLGTGANTGQFVVYDGPGSTVTVTGLTNLTTYNFAVYVSNGDGYSDATSVSATPAPPLTFADVVMPQYIGGYTAGANANSDRLPFAYRATLGGLAPNATYRYFNQAINPNDPADTPTTNGSGNPIFVTASGAFGQASSPSLSTAGGYGELTADASGNYTGWFVLEPTGSARFAATAGKAVRMRILLNDGAGGTSVVSRATSPSDVLVRALGGDPTDATGVYGNSFAPARNFVFTYDNVAGTGRPLAGTFVESDGNTIATYAAFYTTNVDGQAGVWGTITPNDNANGIRRVEQRDLATGAVAGCPASSATGTWPSGTVTASPAGGPAALRLTRLDAPLTCDVYVGLSSATRTVPEGNTGTTDVQLTVSVTNPPASPLTVTVADLGTGTATLGSDYLFNTQTLTFAAAGTQTVTLTIIGDATPEANETISLGVTTNSPAATVLNSPATITIADDDSGPADLLLLEEDFDYAAGTLLTAHGWAVSSGGTTNAIATAAGNQTLPQYPVGAGRAVMGSAALGTSGQDVYKSFALPPTATTFYAAAVISVTSATAAGEYFLHLLDANTSPLGTTFRGKVFAKSSGSGYVLGVSVQSNASAAQYGSTVYNFGTSTTAMPYLVVLKYELNTTTGKDDAVSLFVFDAPGAPLTEPATPSVVAMLENADDVPGLNSVALRQGGGPTLSVDGVRVGTGWGSVVGRLLVNTPAVTINSGNYYDLTLNNNLSSVTPAGPVNLEGPLTLISGFINTSATNSFTLYPSATVSGGSGTSYVNGPVARLTVPGAATAVFPVGKGGAYRPITLTATAQAAASTYTAEQFNADGGPAVNAPLRRVSTKHYYALTSSNTTPGNFTGTITLSFGTETGQEDYVNTPSDTDLVIARRDGAGPWNSLGRSAHTGPDTGAGGPSVAGTLTSAAFSDFSDFALGARNVNPANPLAATNPLPVELTRFTAQRQAEQAVALAWGTASEKNSARFEVQRSSDGRGFVTVATVAARGNSTQAQSYAATDATAPAGQLYYRLRQTDRDGTASYSPVVVVAGAAAAAAGPTPYPNPAHETLRLTLPAATPYRVFNALGQTLLQGTAEAGEATVRVQRLPAGLYHLELRTATGRVVRKFVKE